MSKRFMRTLDRATDSTLVDPNWDAILECVDLIRGGEAPAKGALSAIQKRCHNENPHVAHHALLVLEACMKNCGPKFHSEVATTEIMHDLRNLAFENASEKVKNKILELLQCWAIAFKDKSEYKIVVDTQKTMEYEGVTFPKVSESEAMFIAESAPDWVDGDVCFRCRTTFGLITRKHHCRACGQVFCDKCSNNQSFLPRYGIEKEVRVCDGCYEKLPSSKKKVTATSGTSSVLSGTSATDKDEAAKSAEQKAKELKEAEEYEINLALAISQSEAEAKEQERQRQLYQMFNGMDYSGNNERVLLNGTLDNSQTNDNSIYKGAASSKEEARPSASEPEVPLDPELARYLNKDYWQKRKQDQAKATTTTAEAHKALVPTAPPPSESSHSMNASRSEKQNDVSSPQIAPSVATTQRDLDGDITPTPQLFASGEEEQTAETMEFCRQIYDEVTKMVNRINSNRVRNRSLFNDTAIQSLWSRLTAMLEQVKARKEKLDQKKGYYESLMDKVSNIKYTRAAVDQLKEQYQREEEERRRREREQKQREMMHTAAVLRHQKHVWLQTQQREQMRKMLAQGGAFCYQGYYPTSSYPAVQPAMLPGQMQGVQVDSPYLHPGSPYPQYGYAGGMPAQIPGAVQQPGGYMQVSQPSQMVSTSQQNVDVRLGTVPATQPYQAQMAVASSTQPVVTYSDPSLGSIYTSVAQQQYNYAASPAPVTRPPGHVSQPPSVPVSGLSQQSGQIAQQPAVHASALPQQPSHAAQQPSIPISTQLPVSQTGSLPHPLSLPVSLSQQATQAGSVAQHVAQPVFPPQQMVQSNQSNSLPQPSGQSAQMSQQQVTQPAPLPQQFYQSVSVPNLQPAALPQQMAPEEMYAQQMAQQQFARMQSQYSQSPQPFMGQQYPGSMYQQMQAEGRPHMDYQPPYVVPEQYYQGLPNMQPMNVVPQQTEPVISQQRQDAVAEGPLISFD